MPSYQNNGHIIHRIWRGKANLKDYLQNVIWWYKEKQQEYHVICVMTDTTVTKSGSLEIHICLRDWEHIWMNEQFKNSGKLGFPYV